MNDLVTIKDIAKEANVSVTTVSNVIHKRTSRVSKETIKKVEGILKKYNYTPNMSARSLVNNSSMLIGVLFYQNKDEADNLFSDPFNTELLSGIDEISKSLGYYILVRSISSIDEMKQICNTWKVDGIIILGLLPNEFDQLEQMQQYPIVLIDAYTDKNIHSVGINDFEGSKIATEHLIEYGHRKIGFVSYELIPGGVIEQRYLGFLEAVSAHGLTINEDYIFHYQKEVETMERFCRKILEQKDQVTGLVFTADYLAIETMYYFKQNGIRIPDDISIVGFDNIPASRIINPSLTSIHQDIRLKGMRAAQLLIDSIKRKLDHPQKERISIQLVKRESVKDMRETC